MRLRLPLLSALLLTLPACPSDDVAGEGTDSGSTGSSGGPTSSTDPSTTTTDPSTTGAADSSTTAGGSSSGGSSTGGSSSDTGSSVTCDESPAAPDNGSYEEDCAGQGLGTTCVLSCANGTTPSGDAQCQDDGAWTLPECLDPFDQDGDGNRRYPWGTDLDDDGDGERTYLLGGDDHDDTDPATQALAGSGTFTQGETYGLGASAGPTGIAVGDWDNDGNVDLATTNQNNDTLSIFVGAGDGTFTVSQTYDLPDEGGGGRIQPADLDGDGFLDLVATFSCLILTGAGDGTFTDSGNSPGSCNQIHVIDTNDDGRLDIVTYTYGGSGQFRTFLGQEDGSFVAVDTPLPNVNNFAPGFIDGDDVIDFGITEFDNWSANAYLGGGDGAVTLGDTLEDPSYYSAIAIPRDVTGDGNADLVVSDFINDHISVVAGDGAGNLADTASLVIDGPWADGLFTTDLDADGTVDIVYASQTSGFGVAMGTGGGSFAAPTNYDLGTGEFGLAGADFNDDGRMDFAVINISSNDMVIMLGE